MPKPNVDPEATKVRAPLRQCSVSGADLLVLMSLRGFVRLILCLVKVKPSSMRSASSCLGSLMAMTQKLLFFGGVDAQHSLAVGSLRGLRAGALEMRTHRQL